MHARHTDGKVTRARLIDQIRPHVPGVARPNGKVPRSHTTLNCRFAVVTHLDPPRCGSEIDDALQSAIGSDVAHKV
ncbi:hypothetical protein EF294_20615 [Gordonia oryzae]|uniref:Uncharacterized protein n=1 Tax=Gordonia oryzae TaxID=2487349 RepID=A0A3N4G1F1_9ACTN|nr:hypothetical protein EF294_20615 [Gordonia oryzae]